jgi:hypothetical protein
MAKYRSYERKEYSKPEGVHPIWRGIGCILLVAIPIMSYLGALLIVQNGVKNNWPFPPELMGYPQLPAWTLSLALTHPAAVAIAAQQNLYMLITLTVLLMVAGFTVIWLIYAWVYKVAGPSRYTSLDAPEVGRGSKRYRR